MPPLIPILSRLVDDVAYAVNLVIGALRPPRRIEIVEHGGGNLAIAIASPVQRPETSTPILHIDEERGIVGADPNSRDWISGARVDLVLLSERFMTRQLTLPRRAEGFLYEIVRAQIDKLTPWSASEAAFGFSSPVEIADDRIALTVTAMAVSKLASWASLFIDMGAESVVVSAYSTAGAGRIPVFKQQANGDLQTLRLRRAILAVPVLAAAAAVAAVALGIYFGGELDSRRQDIGRQLSARRATLQSVPPAAADANRLLIRKKHEYPASVIVLEALSRALPDNSYLTELDIRDGRLQIVGVSPEAPSLIRHIEQSPEFSHATFFEPTTRAASENRDHFHIEAHIEPYFPANY